MEGEEGRSSSDGRVDAGIAVVIVAVVMVILVVDRSKGSTLGPAELIDQVAGDIDQPLEMPKRRGGRFGRDLVIVIVVVVVGRSVSSVAIVLILERTGRPSTRWGVRAGS